MATRKTATKKATQARANAKRSPKPSAAKAPAAKAGATKASATKASATKASATKAQKPAGGRELVEGSRVPAFQALDESGRSVSAASLAGTPFVLYFYPKDNTPGCTREACGFRDERAAFDALGVRIFGVSPDSVKSHQGFISKQQLNFTLLSDPDKALAQAFSVYKLKKLYGKESLGIERSTFLVGADGRVLRSWRGVRVDGHVEAVLEAARALVAA